MKRDRELIKKIYSLILKMNENNGQLEDALSLSSYLLSFPKRVDNNSLFELVSYIENSESDIPYDEDEKYQELLAVSDLIRKEFLSKK